MPSKSPSRSLVVAIESGVGGHDRLLLEPASVVAVEAVESVAVVASSKRVLMTRY